MLRRNSSFRNPAIWLAETISTYISETKFFPKDFCRNKANKNVQYRINIMKINDQFLKKIQKALFLSIFGPFPQFLGQKKFFHKTELLPTTSEGFLALCQNSEKSNDPIPRKHPDWCQEANWVFSDCFIGFIQLPPWV